MVVKQTNYKNKKTKKQKNKKTKKQKNKTKTNSQVLEYVCRSRQYNKQELKRTERNN